MRGVNSSRETVNAAATAIVSAEARVQPSTVPKRRWGRWLSHYWCFGPHKNSKRIGHAVLVPEPVVAEVTDRSASNYIPSTAIVLPFIAPPSSPASFLQSDPPSVTQSPAGLLSLTAFSADTCSSRGPASVFTVGPYAYETQLVTPPVFSAVTTEPSTAPYTPPPESVQLTTPSSPEVPFAQLVTSLNRAQGNNRINQKLALSDYGFQPYHPYPGSPGGNLISPGSALSNSGRSSPFPDKILEFRKGEAPRLLVFEHFTGRRWSSRLGSGSLTPDGIGINSRLGSGTVTPDGAWQGSRLGSGTLTPDGAGICSRLGSGTVTPDGADLCSGLGSGCPTPNGTLVCARLGYGTLMNVGLLPSGQEAYPPEQRMTGVDSLATSENGCQEYVGLIHHRVSFELTGEDVARRLANKEEAFDKTSPETPQDATEEGQSENKGRLMDESTTSDELPNKARGGEDHCYQRQRSITLGSFKDFNFEHTKSDVPGTAFIESDWWVKEKMAAKEARPGSSWSFFPMLQPGVS